MLDILTKTGLLAAKPVSFPLEQNHKLALDESEHLSDVKAYRRLVGKLIYLSNTCPDLAYSIHVLSQFMQQATEDPLGGSYTCCLISERESRPRHLVAS